MTKPTGNSDIDIHGDQNVTITSDVHGNVTVIYGGRDVRAEELAYLDGLIERYQYWAEKYTPLAGIAEVRAAVKQGPRLDLPMLFMPTGFEKLEEHGFGMERPTERVPVDDLREAVARYKRLVLLGEPGSGKTTTLWRLAYDYAVAARDDPHAPMPLLVPLGGYTGTESALTFAQNHFEELTLYLPAYLRSKRVILLLDALNEMPQSGYTERVRRIQAVLDTYPNTPAIVTCRALDYVETLRLEKLEVKPLNPDRQRAYLHRYLDEADGEKLFWQMAGDEVGGLWQVWHGAGGTWRQFLAAEKIPDAVYKRTSGAQDRLWERLRQGWLPPLWVLGRNPFMLVMLAQVYTASEGILPQNRGRLFAAFVDTLLGREEERCDPTTWPGADALRLAMARLAYAMQEAGERGTAVEADWAWKQLAQPNADTDRIAYLCASATLLDTSNSQVRFVHQLVQEYFAALALAGRLENGDDLRQYLKKDWTQPSGWEETVILLAGMLPDMTPLVEQLLPVNPALAARCIAESGGKRPHTTLSQRIQEMLVGIATSLEAPVMQRSVAGNALNHLGDPRPGVGLRPNELPDVVWCFVPAGEYRMGTTQMNDGNAHEYEMPQHKLWLDAFEIGKYPITNAQYMAFINEAGYTQRWKHCWTKAGWQWKGNRTQPERAGGEFDLPNHPAVMITWHEAVSFCNWMTVQLRATGELRSNQQVSLPTEAQWEKAARGQNGRRYPGTGKLTRDVANFEKTDISTTSAVGIFPKGESPYGCLDMSGNVWEWTCSLWGNAELHPSYSYPYNSRDGRENQNAPDEILRVVRGGSYLDNARGIRCTCRDGCDPRRGLEYGGFRIVITSKSGPGEDAII